MLASFGGSLDLPPHQLRTFVTVARRLSFTRAAEDLHLTQPAVSIHIRKLERAVGSRLFEHVGRRVVLTAVGQTVYGYAERALALEDELRATLADVGGVPRGPFEIGTSTTIGISILPMLVQRFVAANPEVRLHVRVGMSSEIIAAVLDGQLDVALVVGAIDNDRLEAEAVMDEELVLIVSPRHHWAARSGVEPHELIGEPMLVTWSGSWSGSLIAEQMAAHGISLDIIARSNSHPAIARLVEVGVGAGIVSRLAVTDELAQGRLVAVPLRDVDFRRCVSLVVHRDKHPTPALRAFRQLVAELRTPVLA